MGALSWEVVATIIGAMSMLVGIPLTVIVFYLRAIREDQRVLQASLALRVDKIEAQCDSVEKTLERAERRYTTKEEWIRETMLARTQLGRLSELMARLQAELESSRGLATQFVRATNAIIELTDRLGRRLTDWPAAGGVRESASGKTDESGDP